MKLAVFGGSFNPLHIGHAMLADSIIKELGYDKVLFTPTYMPPHKQINAVIAPEHRVKMLELFCQSEGDGHFELETCEIERKGVSYTVDTLEYLTEKYKGKLEGKPAFILGDEVAAEFEKWRNPDRIVELADLIITHRQKEDYIVTKNDGNVKNTPTGNYKGDFSVKFDAETFKYPFIFLQSSVLSVSSSEIRKRIENKDSFKYLLPAAVYDYIVRNKLYNY